jgi:hypothetical protein
MTKSMISDNKICLGNMKECKGILSGVLTHDEIKHFGLISENFYEKCLKGTSYDLRLGEGHYLYNSKSEKWELIWIGKDATPDEFIQKDIVTIEPFGTALIQLKETIDTRSCITKFGIFVVGKFDLKLKMFIRGLMSQQATQVEPNGIGKLFCYIFNQTSEPIGLRYEEKIATLEFYYVSCLTQCESKQAEKLIEMFDSEHVNGKYREDNESNEIRRFCSEHGIKDVRFFKHDPLIKLPQKGGLTYFYEEFNRKDALIDKTIDKMNFEFNNHLKLIMSNIKNLEDQIKLYYENHETLKGLVRENLDKKDKENKFKFQNSLSIISIIIAIICTIFTVLNYNWSFSKTPQNQIQKPDKHINSQINNDSIK